MIVVDTSALMAILFNEPQSDACARAIRAESDRLISAGTIAEVLVVATWRNADAAMTRLIEGGGIRNRQCDVGIRPAGWRGSQEMGKGRHPPR
jgi:ribonuclease VapC